MERRSVWLREEPDYSPQCKPPERMLRLSEHLENRPSDC